MITRPSVKVGVAAPVLVALLFLLVASQNGAMKAFRHDPAASAPVTAIHAGAGAGKAAQGLARPQSQATAPNPAKPPVTNWSGGPADAGSGVVYQAPTITNSASCGPRPCRRP